MKYKIFKGMSDTSVRMMMRLPYLMVLYYSMTVFETDEIPTLCVNGTSMWVNPKFWNQLSREQKLTACVHEVFHKLCLHTTRRGARDPYIYNEAGDHYINNRLKAMGLVPLENLVIDGQPWSWLCDPKYADAKWTTEAIYDDIVKEREQNEPKDSEEPGEEDGESEGDGEGEEQGGTGGDGAGDDGDPQPQPGGSRVSGQPGKAGAGGTGNPAQDPGAVGSGDGAAEGTDGQPSPVAPPRRVGSEESERRLGPMRDLRDLGTGPDGEDDGSGVNVKDFEEEVKRELKEAEQAAKVKGNVPGWLERIVGKAFHAKVNWWDTLYEHLKGMSKADYSWRRWSKREYVKTGCIAPDMYQPSMGGILKMIDTSGSVSGRELGLYDKHMVDVIDQVKPKWVAIAYWDTMLHRLDKFERYEYDLDVSMLKPVGGGGTDFTRWQDVLDELEEQPDVVLAYTDMCATFPAQELSVPTVWLSTSSVDEAPFGTVININ
jgi:predicted metal-dependent peptidase